MKTTIGIFVVILLVTLNFQAEAQKAKMNSCLTGISNLTEEQKSSITELESSYQKQMADFRTERQATTDVAVKAAVRAKMLEARNEHQNAVKALLNADQQKEFANWQENHQKNRSNKANLKGNRKGKGQGVGNTSGRGQRTGNGQGNGTEHALLLINRGICYESITNQIVRIVIFVSRLGAKSGLCGRTDIPKSDRWFYSNC